MRGISFVVVVAVAIAAAGCEGKKKQPAKTSKAPIAATPAVHAGPRPSLPPPERPTLYKLDREVFIWSFAEARNTADAWQLAAATFQNQLASCTADCADTAWAAVLAHKNALKVEPIKPPPEDAPAEPLPPQVQAMVEAIDQYVAYGDPTDPQVGNARFLGASTMFRWRQPDAVERLEAILRDHRDLEVAEFAANQLLDTLMRLGRMDELRAWALELLADATFLAGKDELRQTLERIRAATEPGAEP